MIFRINNFMSKIVSLTFFPKLKGITKKGRESPGEGISFPRKLNLFFIKISN